ncbi:MAG: alpha/beta fold hydrolase, partial [Paracoccaceae bacterium]
RAARYAGPPARVSASKENPMVEPVTLPTTRFGDGSAVPLVMAHGLFGRGRNFTSAAKALVAGRPVVTLDMRNHGDAPHDTRMDYPAMAADLAAAIEREADGRAVLLGHSMGGKAAMTLALTRPDLLAGLIVADIAPVPYDHPEHADIVAAMRGLDLDGVGKRSDADAPLSRAIPDPGVRAFVMQNLAIEGGRARWRPNLDALAAGMPAILGFPEETPEPVYEGPTLFLHGAASDYAGPSTHARIRALFPEAEIEAVDGAGHWLHAEKPQAFVTAVDGWLSRL